MQEKARFTKATKATDLAIQTIIDEYVQSSGSRNDAGEQLKGASIRPSAPAQYLAALAPPRPRPPCYSMR